MAKIKSFDVMVGATVKFNIKNELGVVSDTRKCFNNGDGLHTKWANFTFTKSPLITFNIHSVKTMKGFSSAIENSLKTLINMGPTNITPIFDGNQASLNDFEKLYDATNKLATQPFPTSSSINIAWKKEEDNNWPDVIDPLDESHLEACSMLVRTLDAYLGFPSFAWDEENYLKQAFARWSVFSPRTLGNGWHGLQYYGLTNSWINYLQCRDLVFGNTTTAFKDLMSDCDIFEKKYYGKDVKDLLSQPEEATILEIAKNSSSFHDARWYREQREKAA